MVFQGQANDAEPTSETPKPHAASPPNSKELTARMRLVQQLHSHGGEQVDNPNHQVGVQHMQQDISSSRLTDMLGNVSSPKNQFGAEFHPNCPSAVPSPLQRVTAQHGPHGPPQGVVQTPVTPIEPPQTGTLSDGSNILTHFYMCNEHMDTMGRTLFDLVGRGGNAQMALIADKHRALTTMLDERFEDMKAQINSVDQRMDEQHAQHKAVAAKLDHLLEFIKTEVVEPTAIQTRKNADIDKDIKALQNALQDIKVSMESSTHIPAVALPGQTGILTGPPNHRSQPSLANPYDTAAGSNRDYARVPHMQDMRSNAHFRHVIAGSGNNSNSNGQNNTATTTYNNGYNNAHNQGWPYRPQNGINESKDRSQVYPSSNPYQNSSTEQAMSGGGSGVGFYGGVPGYYAGNANEVFNYQGAPK